MTLKLCSPCSPPRSGHLPLAAAHRRRVRRRLTLLLLRRAHPHECHARAYCGPSSLVHAHDDHRAARIFASLPCRQAVTVAGPSVIAPLGPVEPDIAVLTSPLCTVCAGKLVMVGLPPDDLAIKAVQLTSREHCCGTLLSCLRVIKAIVQLYCLQEVVPPAPRGPCDEGGAADRT